MPALFDHRLRAMRRDRATASGPDTFLHDRAFADCLERLDLVRRDFGEALLAGSPNAEWPRQVRADSVTVIDPGPAMAAAASGVCADLENLPFPVESFDLAITIGLLDTANDLGAAARAMYAVLKPGGLLIGAIAGGQSLPRLRAAMLAADSLDAKARPRVHPRIEAANLGQLLAASGFAEPVVDIDRVRVSYDSLDRLVGDLRAMGATNILQARSRIPIGREQYAAARHAFLAGSARSEEEFELLHFAAWKLP